MLTNTTEIGTATLPRRRLTIPAPTDVSPSAPRRPPRFPALAQFASAARRVPRPPIPVAFALAVLAVLATVAPEPAAAQTATTFISNTGQTTTDSSQAVRATAFTTGTGTYTLSSVGIVVGTQSGSPTPVVKIYGDTSGNPGTLLATMTNPGTLQADAVNSFTAPANTMLSASTPYWLVTSNSVGTNGQGFRVSVISNTNLDSGTAAGWSIGNALWKTDIAATSWRTSSSHIRFEIRGTGGTTTNNPPTVANVIPDQTATVGTAFSYVFPANTFSDADTSDTLSYTATKAADTALPLWLAFAASTRTFSGTPTDAGMVALKVTASDGNGGSVSDTFDITVAADTTPPTLTSAEVDVGEGMGVSFEFSENLQGSNPPPASAFTVTVDGSAATVSSVGVPGSLVPQNQLFLTVSPVITQGQAVVVSYTDPTASDDASAIQDVAGNDAASFTTGSDGVPAVINASIVVPAATEVPADWSLKPTAVTAGTQFRLLFLSSTTSGDSSTDIATYNTFVQTRAAAGHADIQTYSTGFRAVGCTAAVDARDNTYTTYTSTDKGVPIYWLNGAKAADEYEDFYDGSWDDEANDKNESGTDAHDTSVSTNYPITGCNHDGTESFTGSTSLALGANRVRSGGLNSSVSDVGPLHHENSATTGSVTRPMYGLSAVFQVAAAVVVPNNPPTVATAIPDQSATAGTAFSYAFPANTFSDADTGDTLSYTATKADDTALPTWLAFTASTRTFSGTPQAADIGTVAVKVTASDGNGGSVSDTFDITVAADTTPPTLTSAGVNEAGLFILLGFSENLQLSNLPPASAFTVTAGGSAVTVSGVLPRPGAPDVFVITVSPAIRQGQAIVVTYTDPTAGDDATAFQDTAGNDAATFTTGLNGVPAVTNSSTVTNTPATGAPTITGTAQVGQTLTAGTTAIMDAEGLTTPGYTYQWIRVATDNTETNISGATASTYTLVAADLGTTIKVKVSFTDDASNAETLTSNVSVIIARPANTAATGKPGITGTAQVGQTLTATVGTSADVDGLPNPFLTDVNTSFQWIRVATDNSETNIASATASTYTLVAADLGTTIKVKVGFADYYDYDETLTSDATAAVAASTNGICSRTQQVRVAILARISGVTDCALVTNANLAAITGSLFLRNKQISTLQSGDFAGLTAVTDLNLNQNSNLSVLPAGVFDALTALRALWLANIGLTALPAGVFDNLTALTTLILNANGLTALPAGVFDNLTALTRLDLDSNGLTALPAGVFDNLTALTRLDLHDNGLTALRDGVFDDLTTLTTLYLDDNGLTALRDGVFDNLTALTTLGLGSNGLTALRDGVFDDLTALTGLILRGNPGAPFAPTAVAAAAPPTVVSAGGTVTLAGSAPLSGNPWGANVTYAWALTDPMGEVAVIFDDAAAATSTVTIPALTAGTVLTFTLTVTGRGNDSGITYINTATTTASVTNTPATGAPTITGTAQVGQTLTADTTAIMDAEGLTSVSYTYQWIRVATDNTETNISGATASTYTLVAADLGTTVKVTVSFTDDASNDETLTSAATAAVSAAPNTPATGAPTITGTAQVGQTLTADTTAIVDADGLTSVSYTYQWIRVATDNTETNISGATASTYTLVAADQGTTIKVTVSFTDDASNAETLTSAATAVVSAAPNTPATGAPTITGTAQVGQTLTAGTTAIMDAEGLTSVSYTYQWIRVATDNTETNISGATASTYTLVAADLGTTVKVTVSFTDDASNDETLTSAATAAVSAAPNTPATGAPTITGTATVGQTLTADTTAIVDADGLTNVSYTYQWIRVDGGTETNIASATASTYTLVAADQGTTIKVTVSFTDDASNAETLTSAATATVSAAPNTLATGAPTITGTAQVGQTLTAGTAAIVDADGLTSVSYAYQWIRVATDNTETNISGATASTHTLVAADRGTTIKVTVSFTDDASNPETLTSATTAVVSAAPNTPATGAPTITGTAQVGQTLTAGTAAIVDADGLTSVSYTYQWIRVATDNTETNISGATASTHTLVAADQGTTIKVKVSFTDDASNPETLTSAATAVVTATTGQTTVTFGASSYTATEGGAAATVTVALSAAPSASVTLPLTTAHLNGATAADHAGIPATVTFGTNQTVMTFTVTATDDADTDGGESVQLGFGTLPAGYAPGARRTATVTLVDDDANLIVNFGTERHTTVKVLESDTVWHRFIFSLSTSRYGPPDGNPQQPVTIPLVVTHRGGATPADYEVRGRRTLTSVTFEVGQSVTDFSMRAIPDGKREPGEGLRLDFGRLPAGVRKGTWGPHETIEFVDQVLPGYTVLFGAEAYTATEGGAPARVSIHLSEPVEIEPLVVRLVVTHVGATAADYTGIPKSVRFGVGEQTQTITVKATDDTDDDDGESVTLSFVNDPNGRVRVGTGPASATVALADNDGTRRVTVSFGAVTYTASEGGADATVRVELDAAPGRSVTVPLTKAHLGNATAADYSGIPMNVTFAANQTSRTFAVMATAGDGSDGGESVSIGFGTLPEGVFAGSPAATTVTLADGGEQRLVVNFGSSRGHTVQVREGARRLRLNVLLDSSPRRPVTIPLVVTHVGGATEADYAAIPESVTFAAGQTSAHYYVRALPDEEDETGEGLQLDVGPLPPGVRKGTWGPYETIDFLDPAPAALLPAFAAFRLLTSGNASAQDSVESDRAVLVALYNATDGPNWTGNTHWLSNEPLSEWRGVGVNDDGRVTALWLFGNQLTGEIPVELSQLSQLQLLYLSSNQLTGEIPVELSQLSQLQDLSLYNNQLTGEIPVELSQLSQLQLLYLSSNRLTGEIPAELGDLAQLNGLYLHGNELNGPIPSWLVNLTELRELSLWSNQLTGTIPPEVAPAQDRAALVVLYLQTDGPNWTDNTNWARSREPLSEWHGVSTDEQGRVEELRLSANGLNGTIGAELGVLTRLAGLYLNDNELTGTIPPELENLTQLQVFDIRNTGLCVTADSELHPWIATIQDFQVTATCGASNLVANFSNGNNGAFNSRVYLWNPSESSGDVTVRVFTLPLTGGLAQELTTAPLNLGTLGAKSALNVKVAEDILAPLGIALPYTNNEGDLTLEFTIQAVDVRGATQVFSSSLAFGTHPLQEIPSTSSGSPTVLVANFMNGNTDAFSSRAYLFNPSDSDGTVTVRVFTLPLSDGTAQELTGTPLDLGTLGARSALNLKLAEDILTPLGITTPYTTDGGNLTLEFTIQAADARGAAQVFSSSFAFGVYPLQEIPSTSSGSPTVLVANFMNGNSDAFSSRAYLFNPSDSDGNVTVRVFTLPFSDGTAQELTGTPLDLGTLGARSALNLKLAEDILAPLRIALPYVTDGGNLTLEFTIQAADARGAAQVFSSDFAIGTYPMQEIPSTSSGSPTVLVANFMNGNDAALNSRVYLWNPSLSAGSVTVRVFTLPLTAGVAQELTTAPLDLGTLGAESARNLKLVEDILTPLGIPTPYVTDGGNLTLEFTIQAADVRGAAQVFSSSFAFGTVPLQVIQ